MGKFIGLALVVVGVVLLVMGLKEADSIASHFKEFFTGSVTDRSVWLILGGAAAIIVGAGSAFVSFRGAKA